MPNKRNGRQAQLRRREVALQARLRDLSETEARILNKRNDLAKVSKLNDEGSIILAEDIKHALQKHWYPAMERIRREVAVLKQRTNWVEAPES